MDNFYIITNVFKDKEFELTKEIASYIKQQGKKCTIHSYVAGEHMCVVPGQIPALTECILVVGGDGTLIRVARDTVERGIGLVGVNKGTLGYLCELEEKTVFTALDHLIRDEYSSEKRMMIVGYGKHGEEKLKGNVALNDIVIHRAGTLQIVNYVIYVNGKYLNTYSADGIIIATPTGSTGYSMSAGGPIVDPKAQLVLVTPISPHSMNSKSIVLSAEDEIRVEVGKRRPEEDEEVEVSFDGDKAFQLEVGDYIVVKKAQEYSKILKVSKLSFLEILRKKMKVYR